MSYRDDALGVIKVDFLVFYSFCLRVKVESRIRKLTERVGNQSILVIQFRLRIWELKYCKLEKQRNRTSQFNQPPIKK